MVERYDGYTILDMLLPNLVEIMRSPHRKAPGSTSLQRELPRLKPNPAVMVELRLAVHGHDLVFVSEFGL
jgi:hypothetical protein